jgi:hypothetical protein
MACYTTATIHQRRYLFSRSGHIIDLSPGVYTITADIPDLGQASEEVELDAGEVWTIMVGPGGLWPIQAY